MNHSNIVTTAVAIMAVAAAAMIAASRIHYWQAWARNVYDNLNSNLIDRLNMEADMTDLTT